MKKNKLKKDKIENIEKNEKIEKTEKVKKLPRFGVLDAFIILIVIVAIVGVFFRYRLLDMLAAQQNLNDYSVSFTVDNVRYTTPEYIQIGDSVYFENSGAELGVITKESETNQKPFTVAPATETFTDTNGNIIDVHYPSDTRVSFSGRMMCAVQISENGGYLVNGNTQIAPGQSIDVVTELVTMTIKITAIEPIE